MSVFAGSAKSEIQLAPLPFRISARFVTVAICLFFLRDDAAPCRLTRARLRPPLVLMRRPVGSLAPKSRCAQLRCRIGRQAADQNNIADPQLGDRQWRAAR